MDYTKIPRQLIYKDLDNIDDFGIDDKSSLEYEFYETLVDCPLIHNKESVEYIKDIPKLVLQIFNNAYYICTLINMEQHTELYVDRYLSKAKNDNEGSLMWCNYVMPITMALVYSLLLRNKFHKHDILQRIKERIESIDEDGSIKCKAYFKRMTIESKASDNNNDEDLKLYEFAPRTITHESIRDAFSNDEQIKSWRQFTDDFNREKILDIFAHLGKTDEEKETMRESLRYEVETVCDADRTPNILALIDSMDFSNVEHIKEVSLEAYYSRVAFENKVLESEVARLRDQLEETEANVKHAKAMLPTSDYHEGLREELKKTREELEALKVISGLLDGKDVPSAEVIIFFSNIFNIEPEIINQTAFATFINIIIGKKISQTTISRLFNRDHQKKYSDNDKKAAIHLVKMLMNIVKSRSESIYNIIESIITLFDLKKTDFDGLSEDKFNQFKMFFDR